MNNLVVLNCTCGQRLNAKPEYAGKNFPCPKCGATVTVPFVVHDETEATTNNHTNAKSTNDRLSFSLSAAAILLSLVAVAFSILNRTPSSQIPRYDFTTPEKALVSHYQIKKDGDIWTVIELDKLKNHGAVSEKLATLKVKKSVDYHGKKILFCQYEQNGVEAKDIEAMEKDASTGMWFLSYVSPYSIDDENLKKSIMEWTE